jgi:hypothetical protein
MATIFDYLAWRGDLSFDAAPPNNVDNIILSILSYFPFEKVFGIHRGYDSDVSGAIETIPLKDAAEALLKSHAAIKKMHEMEYFFNDAQPKLLHSLAASQRYTALSVSYFAEHFDTEAEKQFAAVTFSPSGLDGCLSKSKNFPAYIAFRGTDTSLVGWKEDLNMALDEAVPSQLEAVNYVEKVARRINGRICLGGHSKGGNMAVYAASFCSKKVRNRIQRVYSNDGPGFHESVIRSEGFKEIENRIVSVIPQSSIIGLLFEQGVKYKIIESAGQGFAQHNPFTWSVTRDGFVEVTKTAKSAEYIRKTIDAWLSTMDKEQTITFIETLYELLEKTGAKTIPDLTADWFKSAKIILDTFNRCDKKTKDALGKIFKSLFDIGTQNIGAAIKTKIEEKIK